MKYRYRPVFLIAIAGGVYLSLMYINPYNGVIALSEAILQLSGSRGGFALGFSYSELAAFAMRLFPGFIGIQNLTYLAGLTKRVGQEEGGN